MKLDWLFLDLDNTLWDFDGNAEEALEILFHRHHLHLRSGYEVNEFVNLYKRINQSFWKRYELGEIDKDFLRTRRFTHTFMEMGIPESEHPENAWEEYLSICPQLTRLVPGALDFLKTAASNVPIAIITNGFESTQAGKIRASGMEPFIRFVVNSESAKVAKPNRGIFDLAMSKAGASAGQCLYIGDTWDTDVAGGIGAGIPTIWYNPAALDMPDTFKGNPLFLGGFSSLDTIAQKLARDYGWV